MADNDVEKFLSEQQSMEDRRKALIDDVLRQKAEAMKVFDEKLAKLGYQGDGAVKPKKSHHKQAEPKAKTKA